MAKWRPHSYAAKDIEENFSFTSSENLEWINKEYTSFEVLKKIISIFFQLDLRVKMKPFHQNYSESFLQNIRVNIY